MLATTSSRKLALAVVGGAIILLAAMHHWPQPRARIEATPSTSMGVQPLSIPIFNTVLEQHARIPADLDYGSVYEPYDKRMPFFGNEAKPDLILPNPLYVDLESPEKQAALRRHRSILPTLFAKDQLATRGPYWRPPRAALINRSETCRAVLSAFAEIGLNGALMSIPVDYAHFFGAIIGHRLASSDIGPGDIMRVVSNTKDRPIAFFNPVVHGILWHRAAMHATMKREDMWRDLFEFICPFVDVSPEVIYACLHGMGHGAWLQPAANDRRSGIYGYGSDACHELGADAFVEWSLLSEATDLCEHPVPEMAQGCSSGFWHSFWGHFALPTGMPEPVSWLSPCDMELSYPAGCFVRLFGHGERVISAAEALPDRVSDACLSQRWEKSVTSCIFGLSQSFFSVYEVSLVIRNRSSTSATAEQVAAACAASIAGTTRVWCGIVQREIAPADRSLESPLASWCERFAGSSSQNVHVRRWKACIAGSMHRFGENALFFDIPPALTVGVCAALEKVGDAKMDAPTRAAARRLCEQIGAGRQTVHTTTWAEFNIFGAAEWL